MDKNRLSNTFHISPPEGDKKNPVARIKKSLLYNLDEKKMEEFREELFFRGFIVVEE